jgi:hypothetical protein
MKSATCGILSISFLIVVVGFDLQQLPWTSAAMQANVPRMGNDE